MFTLLADHKAKLNRLAELIRDEKKCAAQIYSEGAYADEKKKILDVASQKTGEEFIVLFVGIFSCGKTSMINALIGEELLSTGFLPETAIFCELHYGKQKRITVYPRGGDEPFDLREVTTEEIRKYVSLSTEDAINTMEQNEEGVYSSKFDKMVIYWPLEILKDGVVLVDSPGIDDPYINDYIVNNDYLPKADAIVYVMNLQYSYQRMDKDNLNKINALGRKNIVTACTFYDTVEEQTRYNPAALIRLRNRLINYMKKHTDLDEVSIHFLDSPGGLCARLNGDSEAWIKSGFKGFEDYLGQYLVEGRGSEQVRDIVGMIVTQADAMIKDAERFNVAADQDKDEIKRRIDESEQRLQMARNKSVQAVKNFRNTLEGRLLEVEKMIREFLTQKLPTFIDLEDFQPETTLLDGLSKLNPVICRRKAKALQDECQKEILRRMNLEYRKWATHTLNNCLQRAANFPSKAFDVSKLPFPEYVFELIPMMHLSIIADIDVNRNDKIKFLVVKYAKEFFYDPAFKNEVDNIVGDIMADVRMYVEDSCADAEKVFNSEMTHAEQIVRQTLEESNADLATKTALISQRNAAVDKLYDLKVAAMQIGRD